MDEQSQKYLETILAKEPVEVQEHEMVFLRARRSYLTSEQLIKFGIELKEEKKRDRKHEDKPVEPKKDDKPVETTVTPDKVSEPDKEVKEPATDAGPSTPNTVTEEDDYSGNDSDPDQARG